METLKTIQTFSKVGRIFSKIAFICCVIGVAGCVLGMLSLPFSATPVFKIGGISIHAFIANQSGADLNALYPFMAGAMIVCIGQAVTAKFAEKYFANELLAETPFTRSGAKELLRLGIITISVPLGTLILAQIVSDVIAELIQCGEAFKLDGGDSVALGVTFIFASFLCQYGAELREKNDAAIQ